MRAYPKEQIALERAAFSAEKSSAVIGALRSDANAVAKEHFRRRPRLERLQMERWGKRLTEIARADSSVVYAETVGSQLASLSRRPWHETLVLSFSNDGSCFEPNCLSVRLDAKSSAIMQSVGELGFSSHVGERMIERRATPYDPMRTLFRSIVDFAGFFAIANRHVGLHIFSAKPSEPRFVLPFGSGIVIGVMTCWPRDGAPAEEMHQRVCPFTLAPFLDSQGLRVSFGFVGMTFLGVNDLATEKLAAFERMRAFQANHPVLKTLGAQLLFPGSVFLREEIERLRPDICAASADMRRLFDDPEVNRLYRLGGRIASSAPMPWEDNVRRMGTGHFDAVPLYASREELRKGIASISLAPPPADPVEAAQSAMAMG